MQCEESEKCGFADIGCGELGWVCCPGAKCDAGLTCVGASAVSKKSGR